MTNRISSDCHHLTPLFSSFFCFVVQMSEKPDGTMKKLTDVSKLHGLGWKHKIELKEGIEKMYTWYKGAH